MYTETVRDTERNHDTRISTAERLKGKLIRKQCRLFSFKFGARWSSLPYSPDSDVVQLHQDHRYSSQSCGSAKVRMLWTYVRRQTVATVLLLRRTLVRRRFIDGWKASKVRTPYVLDKLDAGSVVLREVGKTLVIGSAGADQPRLRQWRPKRKLMRRFGITALCGDITVFKTTNSKGSIKHDDKSNFPAAWRQTAHRSVRKGGNCNKGCTVILNLPCSYYLAPSAFHLLGLRKDSLRERCFSDNELKYSICEEHRRISRVLCVRHRAFRRRDKIIMLIMKRTLWKNNFIV